MTVRSVRRAVAAAAALALAILTGCSSADSGTTTLTLLADSSGSTLLPTRAIVEAFMAENPDIEIDIQTRPQGAEGDNVVKTRLATNEMTDVFQYNSGSLLRALHPDKTVIDLSGEPFIDGVSPAFLDAVSTDAGIYGVPLGTSQGGGVLYNVPLYDELGLEIPTTWDEFLVNSRRAHEAGGAGIIQTYGETWTSQILILADFFNVLAADPDWAAAFTAGERTFAEEPAVAGFRHLQEVHESGLVNEDFASATFDDGLRMVATGEGLHYPMLTSAIPAMIDRHPEAFDDVGFFALPGEGPRVGLTAWTPPGLYGAASTTNPEAVKRFLAFVATPQACEAQTSAIGAVGPYLVQGCTLPTDVPRAVSDMLPYFEDPGASLPALEFLSPVKGPALEHISVEVGSGIRSAQDGARLYDDDVAKQARQFGLEGW